MKMLDLSKFEKIGEDKDTTKMRHKDGHEMTILHAKLPRLHREQLKRLKMADGGPVAQDPNKPWTQNDKKDFEKGASSGDVTLGQAYDNAKKSLGFAKGGKAHYAEGTEDAPASKNDIPMPPAEDNTPAQAPAAPAAFPAADALAAQNQGTPGIDQNLSTPTGAALTQASAIQAGEQAGNLQQKIDTASAQGKQTLAAQQAQNAADIQNRQNQTITDMKQHTDDFAQYMAEHPINENAYMENKNAGQKVATALGLVLGGFSGGFNGSGVNPAMNYLLAQQDRNIAAQKARMDQAHTIYGAYHSLYGDENVSTALTKVSMNDKLMADSNALAAKLGTPQAHVANLNLRAQLMQKNYDNLQKAAFLANQPGASAGNAHSAAVAPGGANPEAQNGQAQQGRILAPDAMNKLNQYSQRAAFDPAAQAQLPEAQRQFQNSYQADKALDQIDAIWPSASKSTTVFGSIANALEGTVGKVPFGIGEVLGNLPGEAIRDLGGQKEKQEQSYRAQLEGYIDSALANTGATPTDKGEMARKYFPNEGDSEETKAVKLKGFKDKIISLQHTGTIDNIGMTNKR